MSWLNSQCATKQYETDQLINFVKQASNAEQLYRTSIMEANKRIKELERSKVTKNVFLIFS